ncbi:MAG TPA: hypothetical protein VF263_24215 [Longimicrobiaceae bacterium]
MADEPGRYGVWTTLDGGRNATGPEDVCRLLSRDSKSVFLTARPGAPELPHDGRASEIAPGTELQISGFGRGTIRWGATLTRTTDGFTVGEPI